MSIVLPSLAKTSRFEVWSTNRDTVKGKCSEKEISLSPKAMKRILCSDVFSVAVDLYFVTIENLSDVILRELTSNETFNATLIHHDFTSSNIPTDFYPIEICRASLFSLLTSIMYSSTKVRVEVFQFIADMLNSSLIPAISTTSKSNNGLLAYLCGIDGLQYYTPNGIKPTSAAFSSCRMKPLILMKSEIPYIQSDSSLFKGISSLLCAISTVNLSSTIDCISALSCEAANAAFTDVFELSLFENHRPHRGEMNSATNLKMLLEGSKRTTATSTSSSSEIFSKTPHSNGPALDYFASIAKIVEIELNCPLAVQPEDSNTNAAIKTTKVSFDKTESRLALDVLIAVLTNLLETSQERVKILQSSLISNTTTTTSATTTSAATNTNSSGTSSDMHAIFSHQQLLLDTITNEANMDVITRSWKLINNLSKSLSAEVYISMKLLVTNISDSTVTTNGDVKNGSDDNDDDKEDDDNNTNDSKSSNNVAMIGNRKKVAIDVNSQDLTPEQRAKVEAKQKLKAEKASQKAAAKASKKGGGGGGSGNGTGSKMLPLGAGTEQLRQLLLTATSSSSSSSLSITSNTSTTATSAVSFTTSSGSGSNNSSDVPQFMKVLNFFDISEHSFGNRCTRLLESLSSGGKRRPKIAKGARDFTPDQMRVREQAFEAIRRVFKRHGAVEIDTPVFELKEVLTGKYGEDSKLIYHLADQGGELLSLRYDLTVPFARYLAMSSTGNIKRYHIAKVYRRDQPQLARGRYREFYQCDFDIAGNFAPMMADAEAITVGTEVLSELPVGSFLIKLNHRKLLDAIFEISGVPTEKFRPICSAVDKLDKSPWGEVKHEMVAEKGLTEDVADKIGEFVLLCGKPREMWQKLQTNQLFGQHIAANEAMQELSILFDYLEGMGSLQHISFDLSLARGLDYYTGVIYEAVLTSGTSQVGSIAAGGRYDNLVGMFSASNTQIPCVGISIGIERIFAIIEKMAKEMNILQTPTVEVYIASIGDKLTTDRMKLAKLLWSHNISTEYSHQENPKFKRQLDDVLERCIPFMIVFGTDELNKGVVKVKDMKIHDEVEMTLSEIIPFLIHRGCKSIPMNNQHFMNALRINHDDSNNSNGSSSSSNGDDSSNSSGSQ